MKRTIDYPPAWLLAALGLVWLETIFVPELADAPLLRQAGTVLVLLAVLIAIAAALAFLRARSTIIPHKTPQALITGGIFAVSRNPIYLADVLLLAGFSLRWGALSGVLLAPVLGWVLTRRFILGEEGRIRATFGAAADAYFARTRRWL